MSSKHASPILLALLAAVCFGITTPFAKLLLGNVAPVPLAALLYLGSGGALALLLCGRRLLGHSPRQEARLTKGDLPWLLGAVIAGGVAAPIILMVALRATPAATASLLLNFEGIATTLLAALIFREHIGPRVWWAVVLVAIACAVLSVDVHGAWGISLGALGVLAACICWGIDNNVTRQISGKDPLTIVMAKGLCAGTVSLVLALATHQPLPAAHASLLALALGSIGYGLSIVLFILALRSLGAARTSAYFAAAPFFGVLLSCVLLREAVGAQMLLALSFLVVGVALLVSENHAHRHAHLPVTHTHRHQHDDLHHQHQHAGGPLPDTTSHTHPHTHQPCQHAHPHTPDLHHRHAH